MPVIIMKATCACPTHILKIGRVYNVPNHIAAPLLAGGMYSHQHSTGGKSVFVPAAEIYDERRHGRKPILRVPKKPDPSDTGDVVEVEPEIEYMSEDDE
jgi:hypothetical protein